jgi:hypothetical protein
MEHIYRDALQVPCDTASCMIGMCRYHWSAALFHPQKHIFFVEWRVAEHLLLCKYLWD